MNRPALTNLARETLDALFKFGRTPQEVKYVSVGSIASSASEWFTIEELIDAAEYFDYDQFFTFHEVRDDILIVGDGWWLERSISEPRGKVGASQGAGDAHASWRQARARVYAPRVVRA